MGVDGEKDNAKRLLDKLLAKHHIDLDDVFNRKWKVTAVPCATVYNALVIMLIRYVTGDMDRKVTHCNGGMEARMTEVEYNEIIRLYNLHKDNYINYMAHSHNTFFNNVVVA